MIKTPPRVILTFSDSNHNSLKLEEDLGNLPADHTQSEITAEMLDSKLSGVLFNGANLALTGKKEGQVTPVVANAHCVASEDLAQKTSNTLQGMSPVTHSSRSYLIVDPMVTYCFMRKE